MPETDAEKLQKQIDELAMQIALIVAGLRVQGVIPAETKK